MTQPIDEMERISAWFTRVFVQTKDLSDAVVGRAVFAECNTCHALLQVDRDMLVKHYMWHAKMRTRK